MPNNNTPAIIAIVAFFIVIVGGGAYAFSQINKSSYMPNDKNMGSMSNTSNNNSMGNMDHSMMSMDMAAVVLGDQTFIEQMIPHHQEAVDTSKIIIAKTSDPELKEFAQNVINDQTKEIEQMKGWYKTWFNKDYASAASTNMMGNLTQLSGLDLDKSYIKGMIMHHQGAISMAKKIQSITQKDEIKQLANNIVTSQTKEIATLLGWMMSKYNDRSMMGM